MNISLNWLKKYVNLPKGLDPKDFGLKLTLATVEVEGYENRAENLDNVVVAKIMEIQKHPDADKLRIVIVDDGRENLSVVCGGSNLEIGMSVALARVGARVKWHGEGEYVTLEKAKIRGVESFGMICASVELGLAEMFPAKSEHEILDLSFGNFKPGTGLAEALGLDDIIYDIDNKSLTNRPDLWGHYGMAREVAAIYNKKLKPYEISKIKVNQEVDLQVEVKEPELCPRYMAVVIDGVKIGPSPDWLRKSLQAVGLRSINNVVDVTNYIMLDLGQPLHAFDSNLVKKNKIIVRRAHKAEKFVTLDGKEHELNPENLLITDSEKPLAIAGIMGGLHSGITEQTERIIIESANFNDFNIRKTSEQVGLRTEASMRYEKSLDPNLTELALNKAINLILETCPDAKIISEMVDEYGKKLPEIEIKTSYEFIRQRIGSDFKDKDIKNILNSLGFELKGDLKVKVPTWRATKDVSVAEDLVEEVARMYGYDNLTPKMPSSLVSLPEKNNLRELERQAKNILVYQNRATEVMNYSFVSENLLDTLGLNVKKHIVVENPINEDYALLRRHLFLGLLNNVIDNLRFDRHINIFECGRVFLADKEGEALLPNSELKLPYQPLILAGAYTRENDLEPFYVVKNMVQELLLGLGYLFTEEVIAENIEWLHPQRNLQLSINNVKIARIGEVHPRILQQLDIEQKVGFWEINLSELINLEKVATVFEPIAKFPEVTLDVSLIVSSKYLWKDIKKVILSTKPEYIYEVDLFDIYKNDKIGVDNHSLAFRVHYRAEDRTLDLAEVNEYHGRVLENLKKSFEAEIR